MEVLADRSLTRKEANRMKATLELDLIAYFKELERAVMSIFEQGEKEGLSADEIVASVEDLFNE